MAWFHVYVLCDVWILKDDILFGSSRLHVRACWECDIFVPERKYQKLISAFCSSCHPGEGFSFEQEKTSPKLKSLALARIRRTSDFSLFWVLLRREWPALVREHLSPGPDLLAWAKTTTVECLVFVSYEWMITLNLKAWIGRMNMHEMVFDNMCSINVWTGIWEMWLI